MKSRSARHRVLIVGSGFGGLFTARALRRADVDVTLISRTTQHLFQPLLYQVATGILSSGEIAPPTREVLRSQRNAQVLLGEVTRIDLAAREVTYRTRGREQQASYDSLVVAAGAGQSYFGRDEFAAFAPGLKSIDDAHELRGRIFSAFELAELSDDPADTERFLTFVVIGAGPTGVEMAGQIAELAYRALPGEFRRIDTRQAKVILLDAAPALLGAFDTRLQKKAHRALTKLGVNVMLGSKVVDMDETGLTIESQDGRRSRIDAMCKVWAAGVEASSLARALGEQTGADVDRAGRVTPLPDLTLPGHPEVFTIGDMVSIDDLPGVAPVAIQQGRFVAGVINDRISGEEPAAAFRYRDKGSMATISRFRAIASVGPVRTAGFLAWLLWLLVHLVYIIGFKKRLTTLLHWAVSFVGKGRSERAVTAQQIIARRAIAQLGDEVDELG